MQGNPSLSSSCLHFPAMTQRLASFLYIVAWGSERVVTLATAEVPDSESQTDVRIQAAWMDGMSAGDCDVIISA